MSPAKNQNSGEKKPLPPKEEFDPFMSDEEIGDQRMRIKAATAYIPVFGWIYPYYFHRNDENCQFHARQSVLFSLFFIIMMTMVWILNNVPILSHLLSWVGVKGFLVSFLLYGTLFVFFGGSGFAAYQAYQGERWSIPYLRSFRAFLLNLLKGDD